MEDPGGEARVSVAVRKRRSQPFRRPRPDETNDQSSSSPPRASDDASDEITGGGDTNSRSRKEFNLNQCAARVSSSSKTESDGGFSTFYSNEPTRSGSSNKRSSEGVLAPANWKNSSSRDDNCEWQNGEGFKEAAALDEFGSESKVKKVKLKVGGVTRTISTSNGASESGSSKNSQASDFSRRGKQFAQGNSEFASSSDKKSGLKGIPWKDFSKGGFSFGKRDPTASMKNAAKTTATEKKEDKAESVRKSKRVPKRRLMDGEFDDEDDDEIRFVQKLKAPKAILVNKDSDEEPGKKQRKLVSVSDLERVAATKASRDGKRKSRTEDTDYVEEDEAGSDGGVEGSKKKKKRKESIDNLTENNKKETMTLTTRQRALQSSKDASSLIEFPNGLPPVSSKKQKEKLTEVEQQLKKAEAAQKRRIQNEKAARESEAEAIRKILGQDSNRKKKEDKIKKRQEALAEEKAANASLLSGSTIRWVMGPTGTTVTFPNEMGLPKMFDPKPCSYPPPREKCAGPSCSNPYKYRDSKTNLPLCSLQCYKAVQQKTVPESSMS